MKRPSGICIMLISFLFCAAIPVQAQKGSDSDYTVGTEDVLEINIIQPEKLTSVVTVSPTGTISFPYIGEVEVVGLGLNQIREKIQRRLADDGYMNFSLVTVVLRESHSRRFFIQGDVVKPGAYPLGSKTTLLEAVTIAGGFSKNGLFTNISILRKQPLNAKQELIPVDIARVMRGKAADIVLQPQDTVMVSEQKYFISGDVARPGAYAMEEGLTVLRAVTVAGGFSRGNTLSQVTVLRPGASAGKDKREITRTPQEIIPVDIARVMRGESADIILQPQDTVMVSEQKYFISGDVARPGAYALEEGLTVLKAVTVAGGFSRGNTLSQVTVLRPGASAGKDKREITRTPQELIPVDIARVMRGESADIILQPQDTVMVSEQKYFISGDVARPGAYALEEGLTVLKAVTVAGGFSRSNTLSQVTLLRTGRDGKQTIMIPVDSDGSLGNTPRADIRLQTDDHIDVIQDKFYVYGEVAQPGIYPLEEGTDVLKAIAIAGGFSKFGSASRVRILRRKKDGQGNDTIPVNVRELLAGTATDEVMLKPSDTVIVLEGVF